MRQTVGKNKENNRYDIDDKNKGHFLLNMNSKLDPGIIIADLQLGKVSSQIVQYETRN